MRKICELLEVEFSETYLTWESLEGFDSSWDVPYLAYAADERHGSFQRANKSTTFEDSKEREADLNALAAENPSLVENIRKTQEIYRDMCDIAPAFD